MDKDKFGLMLLWPREAREVGNDCRTQTLQ